MNGRYHVLPEQDLHALQDEWDREAEALATTIDTAEATVTSIAIPVLIGVCAILLIICGASQLARVL